MKKSNNKKGFTLVELLVVIAILAILAVVSVVGYTSFTKKAQVSNDLSLTTQMNNILQAEEVSGEKNETAYDAVQQLEEGGLDVTKLTPTTNGYNYVYDIKQNRMFLLDENKTKIAPADKELSDTAYLFAFVGNNSDITSFAGYSYYLKSGFDFSSKTSTNSAIRINRAANTTKVLTISNGAGVDVGENKNVAITYTAPVSSDVIIRTTGDQSTITIKPQSTTTTSTIKVYGFAQTVAVDTSSSSSTTVAVAGACSELVVASGSIKVEETGAVFKAVVSNASDANVTINNSGYVAEAVKTTVEVSSTENTIKVDTNTTEVKDETTVKGNTAGGSYKIATLAQLETFRDTVNAGASFEGKTVELTSDITLKDGWTPIGEGNRDLFGAGKNGVTADGNFFKGSFNGNNHTIYNLNNKNYTPESKRIINEKVETKKDGSTKTTIEKQYAYGLFALVEGSTSSVSEIKNVKLANVDIDSSRYTEADMDSVGALVGYIKGNVNVSNVTTSGSIKAKDSVGGIIGRWYVVDSNVDSTISNCVNNVNLESSKKVAGILGYTSVKDTKYTGKLTFKDCTNNGNVTAANTDTTKEIADSLTTDTNIGYLSTNPNKEYAVTIVITNFTNNGTITRTGTDISYNTAGADKGTIESKTLKMDYTATAA